MRKWVNYLILKWLPIGLGMKMWLWPSPDDGLQVSLQPSCPIPCHLILPFAYWHPAPLMTFNTPRLFPPCGALRLTLPLLLCTLFWEDTCTAPCTWGSSVSRSQLDVAPFQRPPLITPACLKWASSVPLQCIPSHNVLLGTSIICSYIVHLTTLLFIVPIFHMSLQRPWK